MVEPRRLALFLFAVPTGHHEASWRLAESPADRLYDLSYYTDLALYSERVGLDAIFFADAPALRTRVETNTGGSVLDPFVLLSALAAATSEIGLVGTASTTYTEPYNLARTLASLDHISGGRAGWNMVTTAFRGAAENFGLAEPMSRDHRYQRADEYVSVTKKLWTSWEADAIRADRAAGVYARRDRIHRVDHVGPNFRVAGPAQMARSPQIYPLLVQAGSSAPGRNFAARHAEVVFSVQRDLNEAVAFRTGLKVAAGRLGRDPDGLLSLPGISVHVAQTEAEARAQQRELEELTRISHGVEQIRAVTGLDLSRFAADEILDPDDFREAADLYGSSRALEIVDMIAEKPSTVASIVRRVAGARTHRVVVGPPELIAESMDAWFASGGCDGFNLLPPTLPNSLTEFAEWVLPELQSRGIWTRPQGSLRERLALPAPAIT